ncbi:MAG: translation initiation factor IF-2 [Verrucomicrobiales bacterium]|nr:translation initiation factor IF-2 [Verrucomicrobiales bacterium]
MPVRIYEIAKDLNLDSKTVLSKAKELGIPAAKVASSSLDKITAEYLREQLLPLAQAASGATPPPPPPVETPAPPPEPDRPNFIAPPPPPPPAPPPPSASPEIEEPEPPAEAEESQPPAEDVPIPEVVPEVAESTPTVEPTPPATAAAPVSPTPPAPVAASPSPAPPSPPKPQLGQLVGRINLDQFKPRPTGGGRDDRSRGPADRTATPTRPPMGQGGRPGQQPYGRPGQNVQGRPGQYGNQRGPQPGGLRPQPGGPAGRPAPARVQAPLDGPVITMKPPIAIRELAEKMGKKPFQLIADLMGMGVFVTVNQTIDGDIAQRVCAKSGFRFESEKRNLGAHQVTIQPREQKLELDQEDAEADLKPRPPVITIMGHVDHGKTTLLDKIRKSDVATGEAGGITQHIGAYTIAYPHPVTGLVGQLTFLDTPGHAAFSAMRARGANVTDIVVLVVAANDGVMPQTLEALAHAQAAKVPIIVAVNKSDHPNANGLRVRQQLQEKGLVPDDWGGDTLYVDCSGLTGLGVDKLIENILLQAELLELKANPDRKAHGNVIESGIDPGGPVATVLIRKGTLRQGDVILCGVHYGRVRSMMDEEGKRLKEAGPSVAVRVLGLNGVPEAGSEFIAVDNEKAARDLAEERAHAAKKAELEGLRPKRQTLEDIFGDIKDSSSKILKVVVKADTQGSVEAICEALRKIESTKISLEVVHDAVGAITRDDVMLASAADAVILGFHTRVDTIAAETAKREGVQIKLYAIIYELVDQVKEAMAGLLDPLLKEVVVGQAEVRKVFDLSKGGKVAGCYVTQGRLVRGKMRLRRKSHVAYEGISLTLKRFQDEVNEVRSGLECGVRLDGFDDPQEGDIIECYTVEKIAQKLE